jgi:hypothetical protein
MTDAEAIGKAHLEKKEIFDSLKNLRIKADHYGQLYLALGNLVKRDPAGAVFDEQVSRVGTMREHFDSSHFDIKAIVHLVAEIRSKEERLSDLEQLLK